MKRLAIYVHYDQDGRVYDFEKYFLEQLSPYCEKIIVVANGEIQRLALSHITNLEIVKRANVGFDFGAWQEVILQNTDLLKDYDELLLTNNSIYGPIYPFDELFNTMEKEDCDFWGINRHPANDCLIIKGDPNTRCHEHIQSYWLAFKAKLLHSEDFIHYWKTLPKIDSFKKAIGYGEVALTNHFEKLGYSSKCFVDYEKYKSLTLMNPCFFSYEQVIYDRVPVVKRKYFYDYADQAIALNIELKAKELLEELKKKNIYNLYFIYEDLINHATQEQLYLSLALNELGQGKINDHKLPLVLVVPNAKDGSLELKEYSFLKEHWEICNDPIDYEKLYGFLILDEKIDKEHLKQFFDLELEQSFLQDPYLGLLLPFPHDTFQFIDHKNVRFGFGRGGVVKELLCDPKRLEIILKDHGYYAKYMIYDPSKLITRFYDQNQKLKDSIKDTQILKKVERQIKRINRNRFFAKILWWKKDLYEQKNQKHLEQIHELLTKR